MAAPPSFPVEDQTDEDFFDKLVDDDEGSDSKPAEMARALSNVSLGYEAASLEDSGDVAAVRQESSGLQPLEDPRMDTQSGGDNKMNGGTQDLSAAMGGGSKGTGVKEVQWSAFSVDSQPFDASGLGSSSDFLTGNADADFKFSFTESPVEELSMYAGSKNEQQSGQFYGTANEQMADSNDAQKWENLYPGWKYDQRTGQWYQIDSYETKANAQSEGYNVASSSAAVAGSILESSGFSYLHENTSSVLETIAEDSVKTNVSNWNQVSNVSKDSNDVQNWENLYPGWKYDQNTGQWYQVDSYETAEDAQFESYNVVSSSAAVGGSISESSGFSYLQESTSSVLETIAEDSAVTNVSNKNQILNGSTEYPPNMVFDPQYPGWYYDTNTQQWHTLESYTQALQAVSNMNRYQLNQDANTSSSFISEQNNSLYEEVSQTEQSIKQDQGRVESGGGWYASASNYAQHNMWQPETINKGGQIAGFPVEQQAGSFSSLAEHAKSHVGQQRGFKTFELVSNHNYGSSDGISGYQSFIPADSMGPFNQLKSDQNLQSQTSNSCYGNQNSESSFQQPFQGVNASYSQLSYTPNVGRSSDGRPPHALVAFGFGGKLVVMKDFNSLGTKSDFGSQGGAVSILSIAEVVMDKVVPSSIVSGGNFDYFHALCQQSFPGPLVGGNAATKDVNKWIDERITSFESPSMDFQKGERLRLLLSLLKISCQHYGKLRSPFGSDSSLEGTDGPESAVTKLFAAARKNSVHLGDYGSLTHCMQNLPSEGQIWATAVEVQNLLVSGRRKEALQCAQKGQLWGPALVLAVQLGEKFYVDTVRAMAHQQFISGSPLRTLCLLIAGQPADVFSADSFANSFSGAVNAPQLTEIQATGMLDTWEENLAIITANRTKDDELVMIHLGDCLWKERGEITAAHSCYLVAEANFESYSDSARLCLLGADHWKYPRTYASPEAIQRTEVYEYSKVLGNSQSILLPFQPYKLIYAYMLAEVGKVSDSLRYCQASLKLLKNSGRIPEVETWKSLLSSLEDRIRTHQQGGYSTNLDPAKLVGKLFSSIDRSIHRMIGAPPTPLPPMLESSVNHRENYSVAPKVSNSQSTMAMSSLVPSASVEAMSEWTGDSGRKTRHNRSISEPDFGRTPKQGAGKALSSGGPSRFGRIGSQLLQKTMGWVSRSRPDHQAKLGERNKFYYDEKLKRWVEEGAEPPAEEAVLPPPPTAAAFQNGMPDYNINNAIKSQSLSANGRPEIKSPVPSEQNSGIPPIPRSQNQFSARGRMGVRSRYVDTFNEGGTALTNSFQSPAGPSVKPAAGAKFFIPTMAATSDKQAIDASGGDQQGVAADGEPCTSAVKDSSPSSPSTSSLSLSSMQPSSMSMQRFPSMDNIHIKSMGALQNANNPLSSARRASWSGTNVNTFNPMDETETLGDGLGVSSSFIPKNPLPIHSSSNSSLQVNGGNLGGNLHEVEL